ncbi:unnamed protein product [Clonostachys byssicola]|uniref:F-box domain-containing protein n=1 Tax=Clonostachys byssicola TaxID=160290 RepID=A0A9N9ULH3_9HYPO|nr:unnamed protein product [Clonostachys byssicola]
MSWQKLPQEIRLQILEEIAARDGHRNLPRLARVCREWQYFFEGRLYKHVVLDQNILRTFESTVTTNRTKLAAVEAVIFRIKLPEYQFPQCLLNNIAFTDQVIELLGMLSRWHLIKKKGISLGLAVFSPSDNEHRFFFCEEEEDYPFRFEGDLQRSPNLLEYYDRNIWKSTRHICPSEEHYDQANKREEKARVCGYPLSLDDGDPEFTIVPDLPSVPIVEHFFIRRQGFRIIGVYAVTHIVLMSLTNLTSFRYERRAGLDPLAESHHRDKQAEGLIPNLPRSIRQLSLTRWTSFHSILDRWQSGSMLRTAGIVNVFQHLTDFATNCTGTADHILAEMTIPGMCQSLERLSLSPQSFNGGTYYICQHPTALMDTIEQASEILPACPNLRVMELWGVSQDIGHIFRYKMDREARRASITWSTSHLDVPSLRRTVVKSWVDAMANILEHPLAIRTERINETELAMQISRGQTLLKHLELRHLLMHPLTLAEINAEEELKRVRGLRRIPRSNLEQ